MALCESSLKYPVINGFVVNSHTCLTFSSALIDPQKPFWILLVSVMCLYMTLDSIEFILSYINHYGIRNSSRTID